MRRSHERRRVATALATGVAIAAAGFVSLVGLAGSAAAATQVYPMPKSGAVTVHGHGNGHGHGLSQYGARGAAMTGVSARTIVGFYYPGTVRTTISASTLIRVSLAGAGGHTCIQAKTGLTVTGVSGTLASSGVQRFRLVPSGAGLALQRGTAAGCVGAGWSTVRSGLPSRVDIKSSQGYVHMYRSDGTATDYRGTIGAVRSGTGEITVNRVTLDDYTIGVVPREMPASWQIAAVHAQALAARTYAEYEREHAGGSASDICESDQCQVYGGMTHYDSHGAVLWRDDPDAVNAYANEVLEYKGAAAFTQYSASDGGWTVSGGQPYLPAKADGYDDAASGDPYLNWTHTPSVASIARYYGLTTLTAVEVTSRDGHGQWGGRVLAGYVDGTDASGHAHHVATSGFGLQNAMGVPDNWFSFG